VRRIIAVASLLLPLFAEAAVKTKVIEYKQGDTVLEGYLAWDDAQSGPRPGVLVVHDWWGPGPYTNMRSEQLARLGYVAFAADVYGKGVRPANPKECAAQAAIYRNDRALFRARVNAGLDALCQQPNVDGKRIAAIGYCFGGTGVIELARSGADIAGVVSFHGGLDSPTPADGKNIRCKVLALAGGDDPFVPPANVAAFEDEMRKGGVDWQVYTYGGAVHGFTRADSGNDPSTGLAYNARADRRSWQAMQDFFAEIFK
jgi:dienelactone hydrolase